MALLASIHALWDGRLFKSYIGAEVLSALVKFGLLALLVVVPLISSIYYAQGGSVLGMLQGVVAGFFTWVAVTIALFPIIILPYIVVAEGLPLREALERVKGAYFSYFKVLVAGYIFNFAVGLVGGIAYIPIALLIAVPPLAVLGYVLIAVLAFALSVVEEAALVRMAAVPTSPFEEILKEAFGIFKEREKLKLSLLAHAVAVISLFVSLLAAGAVVFTAYDSLGTLSLLLGLLPLLPGFYYFFKYRFLGLRVWGAGAP